MASTLFGLFALYKDCLLLVKLKLKEDRHVYVTQNTFLMIAEETT